MASTHGLLSLLSTMPSLQKADKGRISTSNRGYPPCLLSYEAHTCRSQTQRVSPGRRVTLAVTAARPPGPFRLPRCPGPRGASPTPARLLALLRTRPDQSAARGCGVTAHLTQEEGTKLPELSEQPLAQDLPCVGAQLRSADPGFGQNVTQPETLPLTDLPPSPITVHHAACFTFLSPRHQPAGSLWSLVHCLSLSGWRTRGPEPFSAWNTGPGTEKGAVRAG